MLIKLIEHLRKENIFLFPQKGVVVDNEDPKQLGRIKCTIANRWEESDPNKLPWVYPLVPTWFGGRADMGSLNVPEVDTEITIEFPFEDEYSPFYTGYWLNANTKCPLFEEDYPETWGWIDSTPQWVRLNKKQPYSEYYNSLQDLVYFDKDGNLFINVPKSIVLQIGENYHLQVGKNSAIKVGGGSILNASAGISVQTGGNHCIESGGNVSSKSGGVTEFKSGSSAAINASGILALEGATIDFNSGIMLGAVDGDAGSLDSLIDDLSSKVEELNSRLSDLKSLADSIKAAGDAAKTAIKE